MKQLIVEGENDKHIVFALRDKYKLDKNFEIENLKTVEKLLAGISTIIKESNLDVLGIILDADSDLEKRWQEVRAKVEPFGYDLPAKPDLNGTIVELSDTSMPYPLKIGIWLMPNNQLTGAVEEFLQMLIRERDVLWKEAELIVEKLENEIDEALRFPTKYRSKALIHSFLAWQKEPGRPMGFAITKRYFDADAKLAKTFAAWLERLFSE